MSPPAAPAKGPQPPGMPTAASPPAQASPSAIYDSGKEALQRLST